MSKSLVAILVSDPARAAKLSAALDSPVLAPVVVESSDGLHRLLAGQRVDFLVLENELQAFVTGLDILERMYNDLTHPATILLTRITEKIEARAKKIGVDVLLPPETLAEDVVATVRQLLQAMPTTHIELPPLARQLVQRTEIEPLPQLLVKLSSYLRDDASVSLQDLARDVTVDPRVTADLLRVINSAAMGMSRKISKVLDVVNLLGARRTVSLILSSSVFKAQGKLCAQMPPADRDWYNKRSVLIASAAFAFAKQLEKISPDTAFVLGLFQDLGITVLAACYGERYTHLLQRVRDMGILRLEKIEESEFSITHADVSAAMLQKWQLPIPIIAPVADHHRVDDLSAKTGAEPRFVRCMRLGEAFANLSDGHISHRYPIVEELIRSYYGNEQRPACRLAFREAVTKASEASQVFQIKMPDTASLSGIVEQMSADAG